MKNRIKNLNESYDFSNVLRHGYSFASGNGAIITPPKTIRIKSNISAKSKNYHSQNNKPKIVSK